LIERGTGADPSTDRYGGPVESGLKEVMVGRVIDSKSRLAPRVTFFDY